MVDLSKLVEYDRAHPVKIHTPNGDDVGITIYVVSQDSKRVVDALRENQAEVWSKEAAGEEKRFVDVVADRSRAILIHSIDSWDWGGQTFGHLGEGAECSVENREFLIDHPNAAWIRDQIAEGCATLANFTSGSPKNARRGSKRT